MRSPPSQAIVADQLQSTKKGAGGFESEVTSSSSASVVFLLPLPLSYLTDLKLEAIDSSLAASIVACAFPSRFFSFPFAFPLPPFRAVAASRRWWFVGLVWALLDTVQEIDARLVISRIALCGGTAGARPSLPLCFPFVQELGAGTLPCRCLTKTLTRALSSHKTKNAVVVVV